MLIPSLFFPVYIDAVEGRIEDVPCTRHRLTLMVLLGTLNTHSRGFLTLSSSLAVLDTSPVAVAERADWLSRNSLLSGNNAETS